MFEIEIRHFQAAQFVDKINTLTELVCKMLVIEELKSMKNV